MNLDFTITFPTKSDIVYVVGFQHGDDFIPFYVGESKRNMGRFGDYVTANFSASTDFKVGRAAQYLETLGFKVFIKYGETTDRKRDEKALISNYLSSGYKLLNGFRGYRYKSADKDNENARINNFIDNLLSELSKNDARPSPTAHTELLRNTEPITPVLRAKSGERTDITNHQCFADVFKPYAGQELTNRQIETILLRAYPNFSLGSILPNDHASGNKSPCWCAGTANRVFDRVGRGLYRVR